MPEWSNGPHSKCGIRVTVSRVRIPVSPLIRKGKMKKVLLTLVTAAIVLSSCGTMGFGTSMGAMIGGTLGSIAGDAAGGWHGSSIGGMVGSIAGMAVGAAIEEQQIKNKMEQATGNTSSVTSSQPNNAMASIELTNFIYTDSNNNDTIEAGEKCQITFDVENNGNKAITNITPILELTAENKGIKIGNPRKIGKLSAKGKITYSVPVNGTSHLKDGVAEFRAYVIDDYGNTSDSREFTLPTKK